MNTSKFITTIRVDQPWERPLQEYVLTQDLHASTLVISQDALFASSKWTRANSRRMCSIYHCTRTLQTRARALRNVDVVDEAKDGGPRANDDGANRRKQHGNIQEPRGVPKVNVR